VDDDTSHNSGSPSTRFKRSSVLKRTAPASRAECKQVRKRSALNALKAPRRRTSAVAPRIELKKLSCSVTTASQRLYKKWNALICFSTQAALGVFSPYRAQRARCCSERFSWRAACRWRHRCDHCAPAAPGGRPSRRRNPWRRAEPAARRNASATAAAWLR